MSDYDAMTNVIMNEKVELSRRVKQLEDTVATIADSLKTLQDALEEKEQTLLLLGIQRNGRPTEEILVLNRDRTQWKTLSVRLPRDNAFGGAVYLNGEIYVLGGLMGKELYKMNSRLRWKKLADMSENRMNINNSSIVFKGSIWVIGGWNTRHNELGTVETYNPEDNTWTTMPGMRKKRKRTSATVFNMKIIVCGGNDGIQDLNCVECFDPISKVWTTVTHMSHCYSGHGGISDGNGLLILGGKSANSTSRSVWKIDPSSEEASWHERCSMQNHRSNFSLSALEKKVYVCGGWDGQREIRGVEVYDGTLWRVGPELPVGCAGMVSVVIPKDLADALAPQVPSAGGNYLSAFGICVACICGGAIVYVIIKK